MRGRSVRRAGPRSWGRSARPAATLLAALGFVPLLLLWRRQLRIQLRHVLLASFPIVAFIAGKIHLLSNGRVVHPSFAVHTCIVVEVGLRVGVEELSVFSEDHVRDEAIRWIHLRTIINEGLNTGRVGIFEPCVVFSFLLDWANACAALGSS